MSFSFTNIPCLGFEDLENFVKFYDPTEKSGLFFPTNTGPCYLERRVSCLYDLQGARMHDRRLLIPVYLELSGSIFKYWGQLYRNQEPTTVEAKVNQESSPDILLDSLFTPETGEVKKIR